MLFSWICLIPAAKCEFRWQLPNVEIKHLMLIQSFVCATSMLTSEIALFISYRRARGGGDRLKAIKIWDACRATSAASSFFDLIQINMGKYREESIDGTTGANNSVQEVWNEAKDVWITEPLGMNIKC